jgi:hypothetical protein
VKSAALLWCADVFRVGGCRVGGDDSVGVGEEPTPAAVSRPVQVGEKGGDARLSPVRVRELAPRVERSGEGPSVERLFVSLAERLDRYEDVLARPGSSAVARERDDVIDFDGTGFTPDRSGTTVHGSVTTWNTGTVGSSLQCGYDPAEHGSKEAGVTAAYELGCGS